jgi:uncharacterized peroxidase-related enzyme
MPFISTVPEENAEGDVAAMYARAKTAYGFVPNLVKAFSHRAGVMSGWNELLNSIKSNMDVRRYELATLAAAKELRSSYCMLAHASVLLRGGHFDAEQIQAIVDAREKSPLSEAERAMMRFAAKIAKDAASVARGDIETLRSHGFSDAEIFDVAAAAAVRCFFSKLLDALGVQADTAYNEMGTELRSALVVGRPIEDASEPR